MLTPQMAWSLLYLNGVGCELLIWQISHLKNVLCKLPLVRWSCEAVFSKSNMKCFSSAAQTDLNNDRRASLDDQRLCFWSLSKKRRSISANAQNTDPSILYNTPSTQPIPDDFKQEAGFAVTANTLLSRVPTGSRDDHRCRGTTSPDTQKFCTKVLSLSTPAQFLSHQKSDCGCARIARHLQRAATLVIKKCFCQCHTLRTSAIDAMLSWLADANSVLL